MKKSLLSIIIIGILLLLSVIRHNIIFAADGNKISMNRTMSAGDPNRDPNWDWTQDLTYTLYWTGGGSTVNPIHLPYFDGESPCYQFLRNGGNPDVRKEDGWVLLVRDFGTPDINNVQPGAPYFALYNKYRGLIRFFFLFTGQGGPNYVIGKMKHIDGVTGAFTFADDSCSYLNKLDQSFTQIVTGTGVYSKRWSFVDFDVRGYDDKLNLQPNAAFFFEFYAVNQSLVQYEGDLALSGFLTDASLTTSSRKSGGQEIVDKIGTVSGVFNKASKNFKSLSSGLNDMEDYADNHSGSWWSPVLKTLATNGISAFLPNVNMLAGFVTGFFGSNKQPQVYIPLRWKHELTGTLKMQGNITQQSYAFTYTMSIPGCPRTNPVSTSQIPMYDLPLGIYSLVNVPKLQWDERVDVYNEWQGQSCDWNDPYCGPSYGDVIEVREFSIQNPIQWVVNPHSGLRLVSMTATYGKDDYFGSNTHNESTDLANLHQTKAVFESDFGFQCLSWGCCAAQYPPYTGMANKDKSKQSIYVFAKFVRNDNITDTTYCFKAYKTTDIVNVDLQNKGFYNFNVEGPNVLNYKQYGTWKANVSGIASPFTYKWFVNNVLKGTGTTFSYRGMSNFTLRVEVRDANNNLLTQNIIVKVNGIDQIHDLDKTLSGTPVEFNLEGNYPNPFNPTTTIKYALKEDVKVSLKIYNTLGQEVRTLVNENQTKGYKEVMWDGKNNQGSVVPSGIYMYRLVAGSSFVKANKMTLVK